MKKGLIITHPGKSHRDEVLACSLILAQQPEAVIKRRDPKPEELDDPAVWVVDVGGRYEPELRNFDHHQFGRNADPICAFTLVGQAVLDAPWSMVKELRSWIELTEIVDSKGPKAGAEHVNTDLAAFMKTMSSAEAHLLHLFSETVGAQEPGLLAHDFMVSWGTWFIEGIANTVKRHKELDDSAYVYEWMDMTIVDTTFIPGSDNPALGFDSWCQSNHPDAAVVISNDDRGAGRSLFRRYGAVDLIDFSQVENHEGVVFAHTGGFLAKLTPDADLDKLLAASLVQGE